MPIASFTPTLSLHAGKMYPSEGKLYVAPFQDCALYMDYMYNSGFWNQTSFHGVDLTSLQPEAVKECFQSPLMVTAVTYLAVLYGYI